MVKKVKQVVSIWYRMSGLTKIKQKMTVNIRGHFYLLFQCHNLQVIMEASWALQVTYIQVKDQFFKVLLWNQWNYKKRRRKKKRDLLRKMVQTRNPIGHFRRKRYWNPLIIFLTLKKSTKKIKITIMKYLWMNLKVETWANSLIKPKNMLMSSHRNK